MGNTLALSMEYANGGEEADGLLRGSQNRTRGTGATDSESLVVDPTNSDVKMGSEEDPRDYDTSRRIFRYAMIAMTALGVTGVILMYAFLVQNTAEDQPTFTWNSTSNLHIAMMLTFFVFVQGYAVLMFRIFPEKEKLVVKLFHAALHFLVCIGVLIGLSSMVSYKNATATATAKTGPVHFVSLHSWIGLLAIILYYSQYVSGFVTFLLPFARGMVRAVLLPYHKVAGCLIFTTGLITALTGYMYKNAPALTDEPFSMRQLTLKFSGIFMIAFGITVVFLVTDHRFRRRPRPEGDMLLKDGDSAGDD